MTDLSVAQWRRMCRVDELVPDRPVSRTVDEGRVCLIAHRGDHVAMLDRCPHRDIALSGGMVRDGELVCPGHFWRFDLTTGKRTDDATTKLTTYPTRIVDGWVEALIPPSLPRPSMRAWLLAEANKRLELRTEPGLAESPSAERSADRT